MKWAHHVSPSLTAISIIFYSQLNFREIHLYKLIHYFKNNCKSYFDNLSTEVTQVLGLCFLFPRGCCCPAQTHMDASFALDHGLSNNMLLSKYHWTRTETFDIACDNRPPVQKVGHTQAVWRYTRTTCDLHSSMDIKLECLQSIGQKMLYTCLCHAKKDNLC